MKLQYFHNVSRLLAKSTLLIACVLCTSFCFTQDAFAKISTEQAKVIALEHARVKPQEATFEKIKLEKSIGFDKYEVEFYTRDTEYDYEINSLTGKIIEFSQEKRRKK